MKTTSARLFNEFNENRSQAFAAMDDLHDEKEILSQTSQQYQSKVLKEINVLERKVANSTAYDSRGLLDECEKESIRRWWIQWHRKLQDYISDLEQLVSLEKKLHSAKEYSLESYQLLYENYLAVYYRIEAYDFFDQADSLESIVICYSINNQMKFLSDALSQLPAPMDPLLVGVAVKLEINDKLSSKINELRKKIPGLQGKALVKKSAKESNDRFYELKERYENSKYPMQLSHETEANVSLRELIIEFNHLCNIENDDRLTDNEKIAREDYKLLIMKSVYEHLQKKCEYVEPSVYPEDGGQQHFILDAISPENRQKMYKPLLVMDILPMAVSEFLGGLELLGQFALIVSAPLSSILTLIECSMYLANMKRLMAETLGIKSNDAQGSILVPLTQQVDVASSAYKLLQDPRYYQKMNDEEYHLYTTVFDIYHKQKYIETLISKEEYYTEPGWKKSFRMIAGSVDILLTVGNVKMFTGFLLTKFGLVASLTTLPGALLFSTLLVCLLTARLVARTDSINRMLNPLSNVVNSYKKSIFNFLGAKYNEVVGIILHEKNDHMKMKLELKAEKEKRVIAESELKSKNEEHEQKVLKFQAKLTEVQAREKSAQANAETLQVELQKAQQALVAANAQLSKNAAYLFHQSNQPCLAEDAGLALKLECYHV